MSDGVLFVERSDELWQMARLRTWRSEAEGKPSVKSAQSRLLQTRNRVTYP